MAKYLEANLGEMGHRYSSLSLNMTKRFLNVIEAKEKPEFVTYIERVNLSANEGIIVIVKTGIEESASPYQVKRHSAQYYKLKQLNKAIDSIGAGMSEKEAIDYYKLEEVI